MRKAKPITGGTRFGRWVVIQEAEPYIPPCKIGRMRRFLCRCDCGIQRLVRLKDLISGLSASCGCLWREASSIRVTASNTTHGQTHTRTYRTWWNMLKRCQDPNRHNFYRYGGRGIKVCKRWEEFANFLADMGHAPNGLSLDRLDNDGDYEPGNCAWRTHMEQCYNKESTIRVTCFGETMTLKEWSERTGVPPKVIWNRISSKWETERALTQPWRKMTRKSHLGIELLSSNSSG